MTGLTHCHRKHADDANVRLRMIVRPLTISKKVPSLTKLQRSITSDRMGSGQTNEA